MIGDSRFRYQPSINPYCSNANFAALLKVVDWFWIFSKTGSDTFELDFSVFKEKRVSKVKPSQEDEFFCTIMNFLGGIITPFHNPDLEPYECSLQCHAIKSIKLPEISTP